MSTMQFIDLRSQGGSLLNAMDKNDDHVAEGRASCLRSHNSPFHQSPNGLSMRREREGT